MIFGRTDAQKRADEQERLRGAGMRVSKHFAWLPIKLEEDGRWAWLQWVWRWRIDIAVRQNGTWERRSVLPNHVYHATREAARDALHVHRRFQRRCTMS